MEAFSFFCSSKEIQLLSLLHFSLGYVLILYLHVSTAIRREGLERPSTPHNIILCPHDDDHFLQNSYNLLD